MPVQERVHHELARGFDSWGRFVARNPRKVLVTSLFFFITLFAGCLRLRPENRCARAAPHRAIARTPHARAHAG